MESRTGVVVSDGCWRQHEQEKIEARKKYFDRRKSSRVTKVEVGDWVLIRKPVNKGRNTDKAKPVRVVKLFNNVLQEKAKKKEQENVLMVADVGLVQELENEIVGITEEMTKEGIEQINLDVYGEVNTNLKLSSKFSLTMQRDAIDIFNDLVIQELKELGGTLNKKQKGKAPYNYKQFYELMEKLNERSDCLIRNSDKGRRAKYNE
ncbi:hypothetical protein NDU88_002277 [Pleurodeles waltl]|uniref:Uncharacterized protein n=1 Tax=Pleurodeles waltl TaxID=8319 RepID=A0AAV7RAX1_PLEWA|nr:hypothetical protein NDU88_002277 [Pleurodeles waltl]